jgi:hypothetical protein
MHWKCADYDVPFCIQVVYICMYVCMYVCVYMCMYVCLFVCMCVCMCMYVCMYVCLFVCMYVRICGCIHALHDKNITLRTLSAMKSEEKGLFNGEKQKSVQQMCEF